MFAKTMLGCALLVAAIPATAAQFEFNTLIRLGANSNSADNWEFGIGNNSGATPPSTQNMSPDWSSGASREFQLTYNDATNSIALRLYANNGSSSVVTAYTPAGGPAAANATWTLPAASFFVTALTGGNVISSLNISNLSLTNLAGAAINVISPIQQTSMFAQSGLLLPTQSVSQSKDIVFQSDATGSWRLQGYVTLNYFGLGGSTASNRDRLQFGISAIASDTNTVPEPSTWSAIVTGLMLVFARSKTQLRRRMRATV